MDCCHSGTGMDLPFVWHKKSGWTEETNPFFSPGDVQLFSGCEDDETSADFKTLYGASGGAMTTAWCDVLRKEASITYPELMAKLKAQLRRRGFQQSPVLSSTQHFD